MAAALLTDLESVKQYLQENTDQGGDDGEELESDIEILIPQVSDAIPRYCLREFGPTEAATRSFEFRCDRGDAPVIDTVRYELRKVSKVKLDPDMSGGVELDAALWRLWPYPETVEGTFYGLRLARTIPGPTAQLNFPSRRIDITGDWGTAEIPEVVRRYANETVAAWLELPADGRNFNAAEMGGEAPARPDDLPPGVRFGLKTAFMRPARLPR